MKRSAAAQLQHNFDPTQVIYLAGDINYCFVYLLNGERILSSRTLKWYHTRWPHFIRIHKGYLINPAHVHRGVLTSPIIASIIMCNGASLPVGRRRIPEIMNQLERPSPKRLSRPRISRVNRNASVSRPLMAT
ncbi:LytR/AlgR family response regulator transcription factor [Spirosoma foliorum]|uniref:LytTR family transcriptional regulator DNA-binding domain-containing protein n=1 Tax=Spirosoma foliorum TaxID=2710596 RepID=A0A7G5GSB9_9BACT|nr:LytTR family DNA-binding domain-containing protein [Spirosoma foliorum]QMW01761.1 LytTR family transcriptional regulator DNA-binding domain-containing protein [Spirosoma foliorum]